MSTSHIYAVAGIDTDIGKTVATGLIARGLRDAGRNTITHKLVQTGCAGVSDDILKHRELMGCGELPEDRSGLTCPYLFATPCSPHLAAALESQEIRREKLVEAVGKLAELFEIVLVEGAGGLFVPLQRDYLFIELLQEMKWPVILVSSARLGSLNHTFGSIESLQRRGLEIAGIIYNRYGAHDKDIAEDSLDMIKHYLQRYGYTSPVIEMHDESIYAAADSCACFTAMFTS